MPKGIEQKPYVENNNKQEIDVGNVVELKPEVLGNERQWGIFRGSNLVSWIVVVGKTILVSFSFGNGDIEVDSSTRTLFFALPGVGCAFGGGRLAFLIPQIRAPV